MADVGGHKREGKNPNPHLAIPTHGSWGYLEPDAPFNNVSFYLGFPILSINKTALVGLS